MAFSQSEHEQMHENPKSQWKDNCAMRKPLTLKVSICQGEGRSSDGKKSSGREIGSGRAAEKGSEGASNVTWRTLNTQLRSPAGSCVAAAAASHVHQVASQLWLWLESSLYSIESIAFKSTTVWRFSIGTRPQPLLDSSVSTGQLLSTAQALSHP